MIKEETEELAKWIVTAQGVAGGEYVYIVHAPADANPMDVTRSAYWQHGELYRAGDVPELLGVLSMTELVTNQEGTE
jgi:hypothetical protein